MTGFVHLCCHSYYSFLRGVSSPAELCRRAASLGMDSLALTDRNGLYAAVRFWEDAMDAGVTPLLGADVATDTGRAVLLVKSRPGYERLCRILTARHLEEDFCLSGALLADREGLIILTPDIALAGALVDAGAKDDLYMALTAGSRPLLKFAREKGIPPVAIADVYFTGPDRYEDHRLLRAIDRNSTLDRVPAADLARGDAWLCSPEEMAARFPHCPEAIKNTERIARQCAMEDPPWSGLLFPDFKGLGPDESYRLLRSMCLAGARRRYGRLTARVRERLEHELSVVRQKNFSAYFLVVEDIVRGAPLTCGRGSAAASIVSYCLMITHVDPLAHDLFFERFLNPGRKDPPDIDVDFPWDERDRVLEYVFHKYGRENAAMVSNHVGFQARAAVREIAKVYGMPEGEIKRTTGRMRGFWKSENVAEHIRSHPAFRGMRFEPPWPEIINAACRLEGVPRHLSVHSGGVVIAPGALTGRVPLERAPKGVNIIQWEKDQTEDGNLVKIDLLGNRSLAVVRDALAAVKKTYGEAPSYQELDPLEDEHTRSMLAKGETMGVFYVESPAMRLLQKKTGRGDFERLVVHSSMIRPAANEFIREYVRRLQGGAYEGLHPLLDDILAETYGIMCYQEDVCKTAMALAGFDAVDGDGLRKVLSKKHRRKKLEEYKGRFYTGGRERGISQDVLDRAWEMIMSFSGYSFCKPHSASYALVSFKSAWLRAHYPAEFMAAVISNQGGYYRTFAYVSEARRMGLEVSGPDINHSDEHYTGCGNKLRAGLMQIKGLSRAGLAGLLAERERAGPYQSFGDFLERARPSHADAELLVKAGCFDEVQGGESRPSLLWELWSYSGEKKERAARLPLVAESTPLPKPAGYDGPMILRQEEETLGFLLSRHPLELYLAELPPFSYVPACELPLWKGKRVTTLGWYVTGKLTESKKGEPMEFLSFEDTTAIYETTFFPKAYRRFCSLVGRERPYLLTGRVEEDFGAVTLTVDLVKPLSLPEHNRPSFVHASPAGGI